MDIKIEGNPGTHNTFQEININHVENYAPAATTIITNHYADSKHSHKVSEASTVTTDHTQQDAEILTYVGKLKRFVAPMWRGRYESTWRSILTIPEVQSLIYFRGKQHDTTFNRNLVANIIYIMCQPAYGVFDEKCATTLAVALEGNKEHSVRNQLGILPTSNEITDKVQKFLNSVKN